MTNCPPLASRASRPRRASGPARAFAAVASFTVALAVGSPHDARAQASPADPAARSPSVRPKVCLVLSGGGALLLPQGAVSGKIGRARGRVGG